MVPAKPASPSNRLPGAVQLRHRVPRPASETALDCMAVDDAAVAKYAQELVEARHSVKLLKQPITTLFHLGALMVEQVASLIRLCLRHKAPAGALGLVLFALAVALTVPDTYLIDESHVPLRNFVSENLLFIFWWVVLGFLSSFGFGSGLHTFLLFLGPYIIRIALQASLCDSTDFPASISWLEDGNFLKLVRHPAGAFDCASRNQNVTLFQIMLKVEWPSFLWGVGTAIGELPPYFMARMARLKGEKIKELEEVHGIAPGGQAGEESGKMATLMDQAKAYIFKAVQKGGFWAIMLFASIPNPLFDLAGLTCGHFLVPFWTFFLATCVGKAVIKNQLQAITYVAVFNDKSFSALREWVNSNAPSFNPLIDKMSAALGGVAGHNCNDGDGCEACCTDMMTRDSQKLAREACVKTCAGNGEVPQSVVGRLWGLFMFCMISYFLVTFIDCLVQDRLQRLDEDKLLRFRDGQAFKSNSASSVEPKAVEASDLAVGGRLPSNFVDTLSTALRRSERLMAKTDPSKPDRSRKSTPSSSSVSSGEVGPSPRRSKSRSASKRARKDVE